MPSNGPSIAQTSLPLAFTECFPKSAWTCQAQAPKYLGAGLLTLVPGGNKLKSINHLRIEPTGDLDSHAGGIQEEVKITQILLFPPGEVEVSNILSRKIPNWHIDPRHL